MKTRNLAVPMLLLGFVLSLILATNLAALNKAGKPQEDKPVRIPMQIKSIFEEGIKTREARLDIPFAITQHLYLPALENMHSIFFFKVKNADLGFSPVAPVPVQPEKEVEQEAPPETEAVPTKLQCNCHIFLQFNRSEKDATGEVVSEIYMPVSFQVEANSYKPDKQELYTTAYPFPPGNYILSMAIASQDLKRIGTQYFEFSLPDPLSSPDGLDTTPIIFIKDMKRMPSPESRAEVHKNFFTFSTLLIEPNAERIFSPTDNFEVFFYVLGAQPSETGRYDIDVGFEVLKGEELAVRFAPGKYQTPLVPQPLYLKQTLIITSEEEGERRETRDLGPGKYTLSLKITDNISGKSETKTIDFQVK
jgi:hypothetical protein